MLHRKGEPAIVQSVHAIVSKNKGGKPADDDQIVDAEVPEQGCLEQLQIHHSILCPCRGMYPSPALSWDDGHFQYAKWHGA